MLSTNTLRNALMDSMPDVVPDEGAADMIVNAFYGAIMKSVEECDGLTLHGIGRFSLGSDGREKSAVFVPDRLLLDGINEGTVGVH